MKSMYLVGISLNLKKQNAPGRLHCWDRLNPDTIDLLVVYTIDMAFYYRMGYPRGCVRKMWCNIDPPSERMDLVFLCLDLVERACQHPIPNSTAVSFGLDQVSELIALRLHRPPFTSSPRSSAMGAPRGHKGQNQYYSNGSWGGKGGAYGSNSSGGMG
eukprot:5541205-Pyramimonas_sp.AAC.1